MKYRSVIFDLFGTLVESFSAKASEICITGMAAALGVPRDDFAYLWNRDTWVGRATGRFTGVPSAVRYICDVMKVDVSEARVRAAADVRIEFARASLRPKPDALDTLARLRSMGLSVALISDCSMEVPSLWPSTPLAPLVDVTVFSCTAGMLKPDPRIYRAACAQLAVRPQECLYVGDGNSHELTGAVAVGMGAALIEVPLDDTYEPYRIEVQEWTGPVVASLAEVVGLVREAPHRP